VKAQVVQAVGMPAQMVAQLPKHPGMSGGMLYKDQWVSKGYQTSFAGDEQRPGAPSSARIRSASPMGVAVAS
jgi:hypothetical protein